MKINILIINQPFIIFDCLKSYIILRCFAANLSFNVLYCGYFYFFYIGYPSFYIPI